MHERETYQLFEDRISKKNNDFLRKCIIYDGNMANIRKNEFACFS